MSKTDLVSADKNKGNKKNFFKQVVKQTLDISNEMEKALTSIKEINSRTRMLSTTAKIEAARTGKTGRNFLTVSTSIDELSIKIDKIIEEMKTETIKEIKTLATTIKNKSISIQGNRLGSLALTNIRLIDRSLFERAADIRWWATDNILVESLGDKTQNDFSKVKERLKEILKSYTVYYDLILCDKDGNCKATGQNQFELEGRNFINKVWFQNAIKTTNGTKYGIQTVHHATRINDDYVMVYSCKIHEDADPNKKVIGVLGAIFKWREFAQRIVNETALNDEEKSKSRVVICDEIGNILADSKERILQDKINFNRQHEIFSKKNGFMVVENNQRLQLVSHALSPGFQEYKSEGWHSLIIRDLDSFSLDIDSINNTNDDSLDTVKQLVENLSKELKVATNSIKEINDQTQVLALNASIEAAKVGNEGRGFSVISGFMSDLSQETAQITNSLYNNTQEKITKLRNYLSENSKKIKGEKLSDLAFTNIDLADRALYERTADVRWWATDNSIIEGIKGNKADFLSKRLKTILQYYTVYEDIIVADNKGNIVARGAESVNSKNFTDEKWFQDAKATKNGEQYVMNVVKMKIKSEVKTYLIFSCKVHKDGDIRQGSTGVLGVVFDWDEFIKTIFDEVAISEAEKEITSMIIVDQNKNNLASRIKKEINQEELSEILTNSKNYKIISKDNVIKLYGYAPSVGYEGFSTGWYSVIFT